MLGLQVHLAIRCSDLLRHFILPRSSRKQGRFVMFRMLELVCCNFQHYQMHSSYLDSSRRLAPLASGITKLLNGANISYINEQ